MAILESGATFRWRSGRFTENDMEAVELAKISDGFVKMVKYQRDQVDAINADDSTSLAYKRAAIKQLEREEAAIYDEYLSIVADKNHEIQDRKRAATK